MNFGGPAIIEYEFIIIINDECTDLNDTRRDIKSYTPFVAVVTFISLDPIYTTRADIFNRMKNSCDGYGTFNTMISALNILDKSSTLMLFSHAITIVFHGMDLQTDKLDEFECTCSNISSINIIGDNFNTGT